MFPELAKKETWRTRYIIAIGLLVFFAFEFDRVVGACMSAVGCREGITTESLISTTEQGLFWSFMVIIMGRSIQPIINRFAFFKFGGASAEDKAPTKPEDPAKP